MDRLSKNFSPKNTIAISFAIVFLLSAQNISACSWDYSIWQNRHKNADPYYRFIKDGKAGFIDKNGKVFIEPKFRVYGNYDEGIINGLLEVSSDKYIDVRTGKEVSEEFYRQKTEIIEGLILKRNIADNFGFADDKGKYIIEPRFVYAKDFSNGFAPVVVDGPCFYHDSEASCPGADLYPIGTKAQPIGACRFNFIDKKGNFISSRTFLDAKDFSENSAPVKTADGWGYIDTTGNLVIKPRFDEAFPFSEGLGLVKIGDLYGYINSAGDFVVKPQFNTAGSFVNGLASVGDYRDETVDNEFYFINKAGKKAFSGKFLLASDYFKGAAHVLLSETSRTEKRDDDEDEIRTRTYAYINQEGKRIFVYSVEDEM